MLAIAIALGVALQASPASPPSWDVFDGVAYPDHASFSGRPDATPIESNDVAYPEVHAAFDKAGPPGPGVDIETDWFIYGSFTGGWDSKDR